MKLIIPQGRKFFNLSHLGLIACFTAIYAFFPGVPREKTVSVAVDKMNVFYVGVDNPITVAVEGAMSEEVEVTSDDVKLTNLGSGHFLVRASEPGEAMLTVAGKDVLPTALKFRVKRLPDPVALLEHSTKGPKFSGPIEAADLQGLKGLTLNLGDASAFWMEVEVLDYNVVRVNKRDDPVEVVNRGAAFSERTKKLLEVALPGDRFYFDKVTMKLKNAPAEEPPLQVNSLVLKVE